eukprot:364323-Chlamydomonas_euryale.AAC.8
MTAARAVCTAPLDERRSDALPPPPPLLPPEPPPAAMAPPPGTLPAPPAVLAAPANALPLAAAADALASSATARAAALASAAFCSIDFGTIPSSGGGKLHRALGLTARTAASYARAASSAVSNVPSQRLAPARTSRTSAAQRPHGRRRTPRNVDLFENLSLSSSSSPQADIGCPMLPSPLAPQTLAVPAAAPARSLPSPRVAPQLLARGRGGALAVRGGLPGVLTAAAMPRGCSGSAVREL